MAGHTDFTSTPQLRNACDACNTAKVKCSQGRPKCRRCESRRLYCQYSVSLRSAKHRRPANSTTSSVPSSFNTTANNSNADSPENFDDTSMPPPSATSSIGSMALSYDPVMPTFEDTSFVHSMLDEWNADFKSSSDQRVYPDAAEDPMLSFSQYTHANSELVRDEPGSLCARVPKPAQVPFREGISRASTAVSCSTACNCQQKILSKLSELSVSGRGNQYVPFDKCLSENKEIVTLCTSTVNCTNKCHDDDIVLMFTNVALISHVILIYDRPLRNHSQEGDDDSSTFDLAPSDKASPELTRSGSSNSSRELLPYQRQDNCVRLSLGSYQLDQKDEQILRANLLKIELSKIGSLIDSFEKRFCAFDCIWGIGAQQEPKPLGEVITYLKKRLRVNFEALANLAQAM